jgi:tRNA threonylcarbamoyladenosine biosynthesis protein TsaE
MEQVFKCNKLEELPGIAKSILSLEGSKKIAFFGGLGNGKTTFIKELCNQLGIENLVTSPTFTILNHYYNESINVYHFDFYRIKELKEVFELGYEEYFYSDDYVFIEWPDKAEELLPDFFRRVYIEIEESGQRKFIWKDK